MFAYLITVKENRKKKKRGAIRTNDLCILSFSFASGQENERWREREREKEGRKN